MSEKSEEVRVAVSGHLNKYLDMLVERGLFTSKAELTRAALIEYLKSLPPSLLPSIELAAPVSEPNQVFSHEGRIFQIEYAMEAVKRGAPAIGMVCGEGVALAKVVSTGGSVLPDLEASSAGYFKIDEHVAMVFAGVGPDGYMAGLRARQEAEERRRKEGRKIEVSELVSAVSAYLHSFTQRRDVRPLGVGALIAGVDGSGPRLYVLFPGADFWAVKGQAIGSNSERVNAKLSEEYDPHISLEELTATVIRTIKTIPEPPSGPEQIILATIPMKTGLVKECSLEERKSLWEKAKS